MKDEGLNHVLLLSLYKNGKHAFPSFISGRDASRVKDKFKLEMKKQQPQHSLRLLLKIVVVNFDDGQNFD